MAPTAAEFAPPAKAPAPPAKALPPEAVEFEPIATSFSPEATAVLPNATLPAAIAVLFSPSCDGAFSDSDIAVANRDCAVGRGGAENVACCDILRADADGARSADDIGIPDRYRASARRALSEADRHRAIAGRQDRGATVGSDRHRARAGSLTIAAGKGRIVEAAACCNRALTDRHIAHLVGDRTRADGDSKVVPGFGADIVIAPANGAAADRDRADADRVRSVRAPGRGRPANRHRRVAVAKAPIPPSEPPPIATELFPAPVAPKLPDASAPPIATDCAPRAKAAFGLTEDPPAAKELSPKEAALAPIAAEFAPPAKAPAPPAKALPPEAVEFEPIATSFSPEATAVLPAATLPAAIAVLFSPTATAPSPTAILLLPIATAPSAVVEPKMSPAATLPGADADSARPVCDAAADRDTAVIRVCAIAAGNAACIAIVGSSRIRARPAI